MNRIDEIVKAGLERLNYFYDIKDNGKKKCDKPGCFKMLNKGVEFCAQHAKRGRSKNQDKDRFLIGKFDPSNTTALPAPGPTSVILRDMSSRQIINNVLDITGERITVSLKSKKDVLRQAKILLEKKNCKIAT